MKNNLFEYLGSILNSCMNYSAVKWFSGSLFLLYSFAFGSQAKTVLLAIVALVVFDFITGITAAKMSHEQIMSSKIFRSAFKFLIYFIMISSAHLFEIAVPLLGTSATDIIIAFLALTEIISIMENVGKMGYEVPLKLLNSLQSLKKDR